MDQRQTTHRPAAPSTSDRKSKADYIDPSSCQAARGVIVDSVTSTSPTPGSFAELLALPGVVEELALRNDFGFCAYHGGNLERRTDLIAREAAQRSGASYYSVIQPLDMHHHIPSAKIDPNVSDKFGAFIEHCSVIVTVHGYGRRGLFTSLLCGGGNRQLAGHVAGHLGRALPAYRSVDQIDHIPSGLRGLHPKNPCNLPRHGGMQLELPPRVRGLSPLAHHWPTAPVGEHRFPHLHDLIIGLAEAARSWPAAGNGAIQPGVHPDKRNLNQVID